MHTYIMFYRYTILYIYIRRGYSIPLKHQACILTPQKAVCGGIPCPFLEPLARSWSHFVGIYRQNLTRSLEN